MINKDYLYTTKCDVKSLVLNNNSVFIFQQDTEFRSSYCSKELRDRCPNQTFIGIEEDKDDMITVDNEAFSDRRISLFDAPEIYRLVTYFCPECVYLDVTGMNCRVAAPFLKVMLEKRLKVFVVYVEPKEYIISTFQKEGLNNDISETIRGVYPLPGFVNVTPFPNTGVFVSLLGFEGGRFTYLVEDQQPPDDKIRPIIGLPGYKMNYPYVSLWGNRHVLIQKRCWKHVQYAEANSIVDICFKLKKIYSDNRCGKMIIAPIGTKPHAIGAMVYAIKHPKEVELLYDNPNRTLKRTSGVGNVYVCNVSSLFDKI